MKKVLFQGDSITDGNRGRGADPNHIIGHSYPYPIATQMGFEYPEKFTFISRGCSGDTVCNLSERWQSDTLDICPDVLSVLIGINDASKRINPAEYEKNYCSLLSSCRGVNPDMKFIILEPFTLDTGNLSDHREMAAYVKEYACISKKIAEEFSAVFVPLQNRFEEACRKAPVSYWIWDSVHPTYNGHGLIADAFMKDTKELFDKF